MPSKIHLILKNLENLTPEKSIYIMQVAIKTYVFKN